MSIGFTFAFTFLAALAGACAPLAPWCGALFLSLLAGLCVMLWCERILFMLLAHMVAAGGTGAVQAAPAAHPPDPQAAAVGGAVVVIVVGGIVTYKVVKFCQEHYPKDKTNPPPSSLAFGGSASADDGGEYGASFNYAPLGSCYTLPPPGSDLVSTASASPGVATTFWLDAVATAGAVRTSLSARQDPALVQGWAGFQADVADAGLRVTGIADGTAWYERDGLPCSADQVPIRFDPDTLTVRHRAAGELVRLRIERCTDLRQWSRLLNVELPVDQPFRLIDTTPEGQMFYRISRMP